MLNLLKSLFRFLKNEDGPTAVEYAVMLALIIVVCIAAITTLGSNANSTFSFVGSRGVTTDIEKGNGNGNGS
jgi:pilus assembly protein Flp/PilA